MNLCIDAKEYDKGIRYATRAFRLKQAPAMARQLAILYMKTDRPEEALPYLDKLIMAGGKVDFRPMRDIAREIIVYKEKLVREPENLELKQNIYSLYLKIGNREAAAKYGKI